MATPDEQLNAELALAAAQVGAEFLEQATNMFGALRAEVRVRLLYLIINPSVEAWDDAHSIIINGSVGLGRTLWQAVIRIDPDCPARARAARAGETLTPAERWEGYFPDPMTVLLAIRNAVQEKP